MYLQHLSGDNEPVVIQEPGTVSASTCHERLASLLTVLFLLNHRLHQGLDHVLEAVWDRLGVRRQRLHVNPSPLAPSLLLLRCHAALRQGR